MNKNFNELPKEVQDNIRKTLKSYDEVNVIFENSKYQVTTSMCIQASYSNDHKFIGNYKANDIFTIDERIINYIESFHDYPSFYAGKRDYKLINKLDVIGWDAKVEFENGNIVLK